MKVRKVKIIGQPMYNIGDLAACKSLSRLINDRFNSEVEYSVFENRQIDPEFLKVKDISFVSDIPIVSKYEKLLPILSPKLLKFIFHFNPKMKNKYKSLLNSDLFLFSPGGLEFGLYKEWNYLWIFAVLIAFDKNVGIYSRSIGEFQNKTFSDRLFKMQTIRFLKKSKFNGLRDLKSQEFAQEKKIPYFPSIDVVFSNTPNYGEITKNIANKLVDDYIVFTPSTFEWHPILSAYSEAEYSDIYIEIINTIIKDTNNKIIMLPHIYKDNKDSIYFNYLRKNCDDAEQVIIIEGAPDSDLYQSIISKAKFTIAARSHQVIFSINNHTPFLCLSYEHKMEDMLKLINLEEYSVRLKDILEKKVDISNILSDALINKIDKTKLIKAQEKARSIALNSLENLSDVIQSN